VKLGHGESTIYFQYTFVQTEATLSQTLRSAGRTSLEGDERIVFPVAVGGKVPFLSSQNAFSWS